LLPYLTFTGRPEVIEQLGRNIRDEQLFNVHPTPSQTLLVQLLNHSLKGRTATLNRIIPNIVAEHTVRIFDLIIARGN
jgi:hypothetical protein